MESVKLIVAAYKAGLASGSKIKEGRRFFGSMPIAARLYGSESAQYGAFISGYAHAIESIDIYINPVDGKVSHLVHY